MWRISATALCIVIAGVLAAMVWWGSACATEQTRTAQPGTPATGVTLEAELHHAGLVVLRSRTFR